MSSKLPETQILEHKLTKMVKLKPVINDSLHKLNKLTSIPKETDLKGKESDTKHIVATVSQATDGSIKKKVK